MKTFDRLFFMLSALCVAFFGFGQLLHAQCPQNCDSLFNTSLGNGALFGPTTGEDNTAIGYVALLSNTTGNNNTATGAGALLSNTSGNNNTAPALIRLD
jgi:hypothetical protein